MKANGGYAADIEAVLDDAEGLECNTSENLIVDGNVGIGTTEPGNILTIKQYFATDPIADAWTASSSRRWKENIQPLTDALEKVRRLRGVTFDWKADGKHDVGMITEEVGEVFRSWSLTRKTAWTPGRWTTRASQRFWSKPSRSSRPRSKPCARNAQRALLAF